MACGGAAQNGARCGPSDVMGDFWLARMQRIEWLETKRPSSLAIAAAHSFFSSFRESPEAGFLCFEYFFLAAIAFAGHNLHFRCCFPSPSPPAPSAHRPCLPFPPSHTFNQLKISPSMAFAFDPTPTTTTSSSRHFRASSTLSDSCAAEDIVLPSPKRRSTPPPFIPIFTPPFGFPSHFNFKNMPTQYSGGSNCDAATDEGYDEQKFETPSYMMSWSEEQRAGVFEDLV